MTTPIISARKTALAPNRFRRSQPLRYHHISDLVVAALTVFICAAAPAFAIPLPPGLGSGSAISPMASGPRRPGPIAMSVPRAGGEKGTVGPRRPMQIASTQPAGCNGVISQERMISPLK